MRKVHLSIFSLVLLTVGQTLFCLFGAWIRGISSLALALLLCLPLFEQALFELLLSDYVSLLLLDVKDLTVDCDVIHAHKLHAVVLLGWLDLFILSGKRIVSTSLTEIMAQLLLLAGELEPDLLTRQQARKEALLQT